MKTIIKKAIAVFSALMIFGAGSIQTSGLSPVGRQKLLQERTFQIEGYYITVTTFENINSLEVVPLANTFEKSGSKTYTAKNADKKTLFTFTVHGTFSVNKGVSASCKKATCSYSIADSAWEKKSMSAACSGNKAIGNGEFIKKLLFITVDSLSPRVVLNCNNNGNLS